MEIEFIYKLIFFYYLVNNVIELVPVTALIATANKIDICSWSNVFASLWKMPLYIAFIIFLKLK